MKKIKVGYLPLYIKLYDDSNPHYLSLIHISEPTRH